MFPKPSFILSFFVCLPTGVGWAQVRAESMLEQGDPQASESTEQQEELFFAPPWPEEQDDRGEMQEPNTAQQQKTKRPALEPMPTSGGIPATVEPVQPQGRPLFPPPPPPSTGVYGTKTPRFTNQPQTRPSPSVTKFAPSKWNKLTVPESEWSKLTIHEGDHWRKLPSLPPTKKMRWGRKKGSKSIKRWNEWKITPFIEPQDRHYLERRAVQPYTKVRLDDAELETILVDDKVHHRIVGQLHNYSPDNVYNLRVYYRIRHGLQTVESGQFAIDLSRLAPGEQVRFAYPVPHTGELEIPFVEWKHADGRQGVAERGVL